jgi:ribosome recycling factor
MEFTSIEEINKVLKDKMHKSIEKFNQELKTIRTGRANQHLLDNIKVDYYGNPTPLNQLANISIPDPRTLMIAPWDASSLSAIEKAIQNSDLNLPPNNDGKVIRLNIPPLTEDARKDMVKTVKKYAEEIKIAIRNVRREGNDFVKKLKCTEDEEKQYHDDIQTLTDKYTDEVDQLAKAKEKDVMEI